MKVCAKCGSVERIQRCWYPTEDTPGRVEDVCVVCGEKETVERPRKFLVCFEVILYNPSRSLPGHSVVTIEKLDNQALADLEERLYERVIATSGLKGLKAPQDGNFVFRSVTPLEC